MRNDDGFREIDVASADARDLGAGFWASLESYCEDRETDPQIDRIEEGRHGPRAVLSDRVRPEPIRGLRWRGVFVLFLRERFGMRPMHIALAVFASDSIDQSLLDALREMQDARELLSLHSRELTGDTACGV